MNFTKSLFLFLLISIICSSCIFKEKRSDANEDPTESTNTGNYVEELSTQQEEAFDALNTLQTNTDQRNRLYSTFPDIEQPCYPADTSFQLSRNELHIYMEQFISKHCHRLTEEYKSQLVRQSVQAQERYTVLLCKEDTLNDSSDTNPLMTGTWVMPNVLGRRDIILVW